MDDMKEYEKWIENASVEDIANELRSLGEKESADAFYRELEFGIGGLRGVIGAGTNPMNVYVMQRTLKKVMATSVVLMYGIRMA